MRFMVMVMVMVGSTPEVEAGGLPDGQLLTAMGHNTEELANAGILLAGEGLQPSSKGVRVHFSHGRQSVIDGPFSEAKELIAGYWLWQCKSLDEAIEWAKRCPSPTGEDSALEIRQVFEPDDFGVGFTPELRAQEERLRTTSANR